MASAIPAGYTGRRPPWLEGFLAELQRHGFSSTASRPVGETITVLRNGTRCGYINPTVLQKKGVLGYHFGQVWGTDSNSCPREQVVGLVSSFCGRYHCDASDFLVHKGTGTKNENRTFLIIKNEELALRILRQDAGIATAELGARGPRDKSVQVKLRGRYVEGKLFDVKMTRQERSPRARHACLEKYGFDCFVCGANLKCQYGLPREVIHVHHEEPMARKKGPREVDPIEDMKPVCPNCHAVIHSRMPPYSIAEATKMLRAKK